MQITKNRQVLRGLLLVVGVTILLAAVKGCQIWSAIREHAGKGRPPETVAVAVAQSRAWRETYNTVGAFAAVEGATLKAQESGNIVRVDFSSGARVSKGQKLFAIDQSVEQAQLAGAKARLALAKQNRARAERLKSQSALSLATFEEAESRLQQAQSEVDSLEGVIARKTIVAPFEGKVGIRTVNIGEYVTPGTPLVPLYSVHPIHFNFSVPQQIAPSLQGIGQTVSITVDAFENRRFTGTITAVNPSIDETTRLVSVQATVDNKDERLLPGMFGSISLDVGTDRSLVVVPVTTIQYAPYGNSVYVVVREENGPLTVKQQMVTLGSKRGDLVAVLKGIEQGQEIVTLGGFKLRPGAPIVISSTDSAPASENPIVKNS
jgi:membrane fusion protein (multidrug efflux system)